MRTLIRRDLIADVEATVLAFDLGVLMHRQVEWDFGRFVLVADQLEVPPFQHRAMFFPIVASRHAGQQIVPR